MHDKMLFVKDPHLGYGFRNRIRVNYNSDFDGKLQFIRNYAKENGIKNLIATGDMFDNSYLEAWTHSHYITNIIKLEYLKYYGLDVSSICGNHDQFGGSEKFEWVNKNGDTKRTIFADAVNRGMINHISSKKPLELNNTLIFGIDYKHDKNDVIKEIKEIEKYETSLFKIIVLHQNCTPNAVKHITDFTYSQLCEFDIDCFVLGHYHIGYPTMELEGTLFLNPWNMFRVARDYEVKMDEHKPELIELTVNPDKTYEFKHVELPHKKFDDAFIKDFREVLNEKAKIEAGNSFVSAIDLDKSRMDINDIDIIDIIYSNDDTMQPIHKEIALDLLSGKDNITSIDQTVIGDNNG